MYYLIGCFHWCPLLLFISCTLAADYVIPSTWNGTNITASSEDCQSTISAAIQQEFTNGTSLDANFYSIMAVYDLYSNTTVYKNQVTTYFKTTTFNPQSTDSIDLGTDAIRAYQVYRDPAMISLATEVWAYVRNYTISPADVAAGSIATKSFNVGKICPGGATLAGGTFWSTNESETTLYGGNTALFFTLSAYLSQATNNATYLDAAKDSGGFMIDIMDAAGVGNGQAAISASNSANTTCTNIWSPTPGGDWLIDQAGYFMEGLAALPGDTIFGRQNSTVDSLRSSLVNVTLATNPMCNAPNGIINAGGGVGNSQLVQGLGALYRAIREPSDLSAYIGSFLSVQYNAIVAAATIPGSHIYAGSWIGPTTPYDTSNQTQALFGLVNAAQVIFASESSNGTSTNSGGNNTRPTSLAGPIAGGIAGGVAFLSMVGIVLFIIIKRQRQLTSVSQTHSLSNVNSYPTHARNSSRFTLSRRSFSSDLTSADGMDNGYGFKEYGSGSPPKYTLM
ncbi:hypothetical protein BDP27DRAFT_1408745 [Rhodocollybia butyracea]|uniref:Glycoside hydrolase family 76 protein n=1 Tax=Rhodocollybia butyracea TaxID=206335 RepID=A0A9P5P7G2_9AGAR|nr:hypothetical protein BDP27DRAFT_1408745 [Rhodocollybia butyracea]